MVSALAYPTALVAAAVFAVGNLLAHRSATGLAGVSAPGARGVGALVRATVRHPLWLAAMGCNVVGFVLHAVALSLGALVVVQPLMVATVLFALVLEGALDRRRMQPTVLGWAALLVAALAGFLFTATIGVPVSTEPVDTGLAVAAGVLAVALVAALVFGARRSRGGIAATLLGSAAGITLALTATLIKACTTLLTRGPLALLAGWQLYALLLAGAAGLLISQLAFRAGPLAASLPAIAVVNPLAAVLLGVVVYDENLRHTVVATIAEIVFLGLLAISTIALTLAEVAPPSAAE